MPGPQQLNYCPRQNTHLVSLPATNPNLHEHPQHAETHTDTHRHTHITHMRHRHTNTRKLTATMTTGSSERPCPSWRYALSRKFPRAVGKEHSDTKCVVVVSRAFDAAVAGEPPSTSKSVFGAITTSASLYLLNDRGPFDTPACGHGDGEEEIA